MNLRKVEITKDNERDVLDKIFLFENIIERGYYLKRNLDYWRPMLITRVEETFQKRMFSTKKQDRLILIGPKLIANNGFYGFGDNWSIEMYESISGYICDKDDFIKLLLQENASELKRRKEVYAKINDYNKQFIGLDKTRDENDYHGLVYMFNLSRNKEPKNDGNRIRGILCHEVRESTFRTEIHGDAIVRSNGFYTWRQGVFHVIPSYELQNYTKMELSDAIVKLGMFNRNVFADLHKEFNRCSGLLKEHV